MEDVMDYDSMPAGREMDALVAEKVMGLSPKKGYGHYVYELQGGGARFVPKYYSTSISAAWEVVEKLKKERHFELRIFSGSDEVPYWTVEAFSHGYRPFQDQRWAADGDTASLAICRAALKAVA